MSTPRFTGADGPQETAAEAYKHAADMADAVAAKATGVGPAWVRVEYVQQLAVGLRARASEAGR